MISLSLIWLLALVAPIHRTVTSYPIVQKDRAFSRSEITIKAREELVFKNEDSVVHNVFSTAPDIAFNLKTQQPGSSTPVAFLKAGSGEVRCAIHPTMKLHVTVTE